MSTDLTELFENNRRWAEHVEAREPGFFTKLLAQQTPQYLWIGCADSRVPANELVDLLPGELFVHRNVANVVVPSDLNALSVVQYAVDHLKVRHIIVVGHSNCGGVNAALNNLRAGLVDNWLRHVQEVRDRHLTLLNSLPPALRLNTLCELNVLEQSRNVCRTTVVEEAWLRSQEVVVHGWVYGLHNGLIEDLRMTVACTEDVEPAYSRALATLTQRALAAATRYPEGSAAAAAVSLRTGSPEPAPPAAPTPGP
ncbi:MAG: carbonate dehydratase [Burkholderiales bacterium]|jgi:carbonic anhydrase|nr:carbonate dehydratase [Burkholderiales bacterium]MBP7520528.1 carbonate dehydratase [Leptothrix sp. (in: b-proteobacteria)]HQY08947.1 carbonate dehydratase [Burkholderiaceae bacterium]